jgi:bifunctional non-homologous end joining protein LigD
MSVLREIKKRVAASKAAFIEPCQPTAQAKPPSGPGWIHEIKHDGYRLQARRGASGRHLITRNGNDWTSRLPSIVEGLKALGCRSCLIDGEVVVTDANGLASFNLLRTGSRVRPDAFLYAFDVLEINGKDLRLEPLEKRKQALERLLRTAGENAGIRYVDHLDFADAQLIFDHACNLGCEGIVSKRLGSRYRSGPSRDWIKTKNPASHAVKREAEEDWNGGGRRR